MNEATPTPTQVTEAHRITVRAMRSVGDETWALSYEKAAQLIADSEAMVVAEVVNALTCTHHNDAMRAACPVCLVTALATERDQLRAEVERLGHLEAVLRSSAADMTAGSITAGGVADLRAENERLRRAYVRPDDIRAQLESAIAHAEADTARLNWLEANPEAIAASSVHKSTFGRKVWWRGGEGDYDTARAAIDAAMREDAK